MDITDFITGGFIGSVITLIIKYLMDIWSAGTAYKRELCKQVFLRKTDVVERAMSWYQEAVDMYSLFQMAAQEYDGSSNLVTVGKVQLVCMQMEKQIQEAPTKLNPIYLYYDFTDINEKYHVEKSAQVMNKAFVLIGQIQQYIGTPPTNEKELEFQRFCSDQLKPALDTAASMMDYQKFAIVEIQQRLRTEYQKYMK